MQIPYKYQFCLRHLKVGDEFRLVGSHATWRGIITVKNENDIRADFYAAEDSMAARYNIPELKNYRLTGRDKEQVILESDYRTYLLEASKAGR
jgi:protein involved in ribonucleotide reduction